MVCDIPAGRCEREAGLDLLERLGCQRRKWTKELLLLVTTV